MLAPVQTWILLQGKCVGCGRTLAQGRKTERGDNTQQVTCTCGRIFIFDKRRGKYKRASTEDIKN
ncbi:MAG: hypothetical protein WD988_04450 [Candidatus Curtissbacteria bacterium]